MGKRDKEMKAYFSDAGRYADLWNGGVFGGRQMLLAEELEEGSPVISGVGEGTETAGASWEAERTPDVVMRQIRGGQTFALWVLENQEQIDQSMPVRVMLGEALEYQRQVRRIRKKNQETYQKLREAVSAAEGSGEIEKKRLASYYRDSGEYLYRFRSRDKLTPVVTLVAYWGEEEWNGPRNLADMFDLGNDKVLGGELGRLLLNYPLHILNLSALEDYSCFQTELRTLLELYACRKDKEKFREYLESHEECRHMDEETCHMLGVMTHYKELQTMKEQEEGGVDMCKAILDWMQDERAEGRAEGKAEGKAAGEDRMAKLTKSLLEQKRTEDLMKTLTDVEYRRKLFLEYGLE